jgi:hypothetical protein
MTTPNKPILCLDFDGVIHSYTSGWLGATEIPDPPVPGFFKFLLEAQEHFTVCIYSSRSSHRGGIQAMKDWMWKHSLDAMPELQTDKCLKCGKIEEAPVHADAAGHGFMSPKPIQMRVLTDAIGLIEWPLSKPPAMLTIDDRAITFTGTWPRPAVLRGFKPWNAKKDPHEGVYGSDSLATIAAE